MRELDHIMQQCRPKVGKELRIVRHNSKTTIGNSALDMSEICSSLRSLRLRWIHLSYSEHGLFLRKLQHNTSLLELHLTFCILSRGTIFKLAGALKRNKTLTALDLSNSTYEFVGALSLSLMLKKNRTLKNLNLSYNPYLGPVGMILILASTTHSNGKTNLILFSLGQV